MSASVAEAVPEAILLAVVAEDRVSAALYWMPADGFRLETLVWPVVGGTRSHFRRDLSKDEARAWLVGHGVEEADL